MKLRMDPLGYIILGVFGWMFTQFLCQPEEQPPEPVTITAPALKQP